MSGVDPEEAAADRRARSMPVSPWVIICLIVILGLVVYAASAVLA